MTIITKAAGRPVIGLLAVLPALAFLLTGCPEVEETKYTVTFISNGGSNVESQTVVEGGRVSVPSGITKEGYAFAGWYKDSDFLLVWNFDNAVTGNLTLYAKWTGVPYQITYELNGGTQGANPPSGYTIESEVDLPEPAKTGYAFGGWYGNAGFTGEAVVKIEAGSTGNKTFWAKWNVLSYQITYELNGGTNPADAKTSYTIESADVDLPEPAKAGNLFIGWYGNAGFTGEAVVKIEAGSTGDKTFWAKWSPVGTAGITVQYWINEQGHIAFTNGTSASVTTAAGQSVVIAASGTGYSGQKWYVNGAEDASKAGQSSFTFTGAGKAAGRYAIGLQVSKDSEYYYAEFIVTVTN
ncbi:MAG: InlB B-repeat-containing protein [Spirochaetaceae bacterium]|jgi:uncharacterized repeat protein (TIGR02543 family)|nr:InlB B-repeat-containing protein [Spirochaetaceae bacterium]